MRDLESTLSSSNIKPPNPPLAGSYPSEPTLSAGSSAEPFLTVLMA